ncbi:MAG TPA: hypothetical protein PK280_05310 [Planctomycetota bacterium]|nr:hypothetical protein [Planctomycetota bacterium]
MVVEDLDEPVSVRADFTGGEIVPRAFRRGSRSYTVTQVNGRWTDREGESPRHCFSVQAGAETYFLSLRTADMTWRLDKVIF